MLGAFPQPNTPGSNGGTAFNFLASGAGPYNQNAFDTRIDFSASQSFRFSDAIALTTSAFPARASLGALGGVGFGPGGLAGSSIVHNHSLATGVTKTFSTSLLADFRFGYFKYNPNDA